MYKETAGDYPIKRIPCEHWWVRYAEFCEKLTDANNIMTQKVDPKQAKDTYVTKKHLERQKNQKFKMWSKKDLGKHIGRSIKGSGISGLLETKIETGCPFIKDQAKCIGYQPSDWYRKKDGTWVTLKEIKKDKGYET